jgi:o-succinylbenzoate---CoA ligase
MIGGVARLLREMGIGPASRIAVLADPEPVGMLMILGAAKTGAVVSPLNARWTVAERHRVLDFFEPDVVLVGAGVEVPHSDAVHAVVGPEDLTRSMEERDAADEADALAEIDALGEADALAELDAPDAPASDEGELEPRWLIWTSGSTGEPRGILISHRAFHASAWAAAERLGLGPADRWHLSLSPSHVGGLALLLRAGLLGSGVVAQGRFDPEVFGRAVDEGKVTHAALVPIQLLRVLDARGDRPFPDTLELMLVGGAATPRPLLDRALEAGLPIALTWGMTETASQVATAPPDLVRRKPGTVGEPLGGMEVRVAPETGELLVRGPTLAEGEFVGPGRSVRLLADLEGWYRTGDTGRIDDEGHVWITGRISDRIVTGGVTVQPAEVEAVLASHPAVRDVAVVGAPDPAWGERIVAVVVPTDPERPPALLDLLSYARERLSAPRRPREVKIVEKLPRNAMGKVDRGALRRSLAGG